MPDDAVSGDYAGPFDPEWTLDRLSRAALARLCREYMVVSMYHDRALMPHIAMSVGQEATIRQADSEWMGSSPIYTERNKRNLGIVGDGVGEAFKGFQFDGGNSAPVILGSARGQSLAQLDEAGPHRFRDGDAFVAALLG